MKNTSRSRTTGAAFTLAELLAIMAVIALLAAFLFPAFGEARQKAREASSQPAIPACVRPGGAVGQPLHAFFTRVG